jgi:hypothetical protein
MPDVTLLQIGVQTARYAALQSRNVQATIITPPFTLTARKAGMQTLIDMSELNIPFQLTGMLALRPYLKNNPEMVLSVIAAGKTLSAPGRHTHDPRRNRPAQSQSQRSESGGLRQFEFRQERRGTVRAAV